MCAWCYADDWTTTENSGKRACHFPGSMLTGNEAANPSHGRCACGLRKPRSVKTPLSGQYVCYPSTKHSKRHFSSQSAIVGASWPHHKTRALRAGSLSRSPTRPRASRAAGAWLPAPPSPGHQLPARLTSRRLVTNHIFVGRPVMEKRSAARVLTDRGNVFAKANNADVLLAQRTRCTRGTLTPRPGDFFFSVEDHISHQSFLRLRRA